MKNIIPSKASDRIASTVARSFYIELKLLGFSAQQILSLATSIVDLIADDLHKSHSART